MRPSKTAVAVLTVFFITLSAAAFAAKADSEALALPRFPSISPDGSEIVFSAGGDLWLVPAGGGEAVRLTRHPLDDMHSSWSPDGRSIVFTSMRDGYMNLWRIQRDGTGHKQLTYNDRFIRNPDWARDEKGRDTITFSGLLEADIYRDQRPYRLSPEGGEYERLHQAFGSEPRLSPDGRKVVFTRGGHYHNWRRRHYRGPDAMNVWIQDRTDNSFEPVTRRDGDDGSARWIDNSSLLFMSDRNLRTVNLYRVNLEGEDKSFERLTDFDQRDVQYFDVSRDGTTAVIQVWDRLYTLDLRDPEAEPEQINLHTGDDGRDDYELRRIDNDITEAALSPDGRVMACIAYGRVYVRNMDEHSPTRAVTPNTHARHRDLAWSPDGLELYFTSDADGTSSIYKAGVELTRQEIRLGYEETLSREQRAARRPSESKTEPDRVALLLRPGSPDLSASSKDPRGPEDPQSSPGNEDPEDPFAPLAPNDPSAPTEPRSEPELPTAPRDETISEPEQDPDVAGDPGSARWHDAVHFRVEPVVADKHNDRDVSPSPDGESISFRRGRGDLVVMDLATGEKTTLVQGWDPDLHWRWSPDGRYLAYAQNDLNFSSNIYIIPADGSREAVNITRHPRNDRNPRWSADGRKLTFISNRSGETYDLYRLYLDPVMENWTMRDMNSYYHGQKKAAARRRPPGGQDQEKTSSSQETPTDTEYEIELANAWRRVKRITTSFAHQTQNEMTPGGDRYVFNSGKEGLVAVNWDGSDRKSLGPGADIQHLDITGSRVIFIRNGWVGVADLDGSEQEFPGISDRLRIERQQQSLQKFREASRMLKENFYRPDMNGLDWDSLVNDYEELIRQARTANEFSDIANRLMGELGTSHTGLSNPGPDSSLREPTGRLGIEHERLTLDDGREGYRVKDVIARGPSDQEPMRLKPGDIITEIDFREFDRRETLRKRLRGKVGVEVVVGFERPVDGELVSSKALLTPVAYDDFARLRYDAFREKSRRLVAELSDGRLGYIHIQAMNQASLEEFQGYLYAAAEGKDGLIIDVRNNAGGSTTDRILTSIMASDHAYTIPAGADPEQTGHYPQDRLDAPRYTLPINMLANEKSFSNSEILAHAFSTLERGNLVGEQTYGGVVSTGRHSLIDGATVRLPLRGWFLPDGTDMEGNGAVPDLKVEQTPEDEVAGQDRQLEAAVEDLLERIDKKR